LICHTVGKYIAAVIVSCQKLLDRIPHIAWLMSDDGEILAVNQQWRDDLGRCSPDREFPQLFAEILDDAERESWLSAWKEASSSHTALNVKIRLQSCQGNWEWMQLELDPDRDLSGQTTWIGTAIHLGGEAAIPGQKQSPQFLEALLAHASEGIVACDAAGHLARQTGIPTP
jgi:PAS domain-containing protein